MTLWIFHSFIFVISFPILCADDTPSHKTGRRTCPALPHSDPEPDGFADQLGLTKLVKERITANALARAPNPRRKRIAIRN